EDRAVVQVFPLRDGKMVDRYSFHLENVGGQDVTTILESFCLEYYGGTPSVPPQIVLPRDAGDTSALEQFLTARRGARVEVRVAERGEKRRLQELAAENGAHALASETAVPEQKRLRRTEALQEVRECLDLESLPIRGDAEPRRRRRRKGPTLGCARRDAGFRPSAGRSRCLGEAGGGRVRPGQSGSDPIVEAFAGAAAPPAGPRRSAPFRHRVPPAAQ